MHPEENSKLRQVYFKRTLVSCLVCQTVAVKNCWRSIDSHLLKKLPMAVKNCINSDLSKNYPRRWELGMCVALGEGSDRKAVSGNYDWTLAGNESIRSRKSNSFLLHTLLLSSVVTVVRKSLMSYPSNIVTQSKVGIISSLLRLLTRKDAKGQSWAKNLEKIHRLRSLRPLPSLPQRLVRPRRNVEWVSVLVELLIAFLTHWIVSAYTGCCLAHQLLPGVVELVVHEAHITLVA